MPTYLARVPRPDHHMVRAFALPAVAGLLLVLHGPIAQPGSYHDFADTRSWLDVPHAANVLSNLPFLIAGLLGWRAATRLAIDHPARLAWRLFFAAVALTTLGSAIYHWAPGNAGLALDRLPIALACACMSCALLAERCNAGFGKSTVLVATCLAAMASVFAWYAGDIAGSGDLRAYLWVQFLPILLLPALFRPTPIGLPTTAWFGSFALYVAAKACELEDIPFMEATGFISGHSLKHLLAGLAAIWLAWALSHAKR